MSASNFHICRRVSPVGTATLSEALRRDVCGICELGFNIGSVVSQFFCCAKRCDEVKLSHTFRSGLQQLATPLHSVSPLQKLFSQFYGSLTKAHAHTSRFSFRVRALRDQLLRKLFRPVHTPDIYGNFRCNFFGEENCTSIAIKYVQNFCNIAVTGICKIAVKSPTVQTCDYFSSPALNNAA